MSIDPKIVTKRFVEGVYDEAEIKKLIVADAHAKGFTNIDHGDIKVQVNPTQVRFILSKTWTE